MTPSARLSGAIEVLADIEARRRPAPDALKDWGLARRFAGSGDRAAIAGLVYDALRRRASASWLMGEATPRAVLLGAMRLARGLDAEAIAALCTGERHAPEPLSAAEASGLRDGTLDGAPDHVAADVPEWIVPSLRRAFGEDLVAEGSALAARAPLDLRVNALRATRPEIEAELAPLGAVPTPLAPHGLRIRTDDGGRPPSVQVEPAFLRGAFEIQDEGSQLAALLAVPRPGDLVVDLCAGGGGKTLALAAALGEAGPLGKAGRIVATDADPRRLAPIHARLARAGATNVEVRTPRGKADALVDLDGTADLVLVDAPCTGSGTWRRHPDAKWRLRPNALALRVSEQRAVLDRAARLCRPGGRIVYVTCSVLPEENDEAVSAFLARQADFVWEPTERLLLRAGLPGLAASSRTTPHGLQMSPLRTGTDGFYVASLPRAG